MNSATGTKKTVGFGKALVVFICVFVLILCGINVLGTSAHIPLVIATIVATIAGVSSGFTWDEMEKGMSETIKASAPAILIMLIIGMVVGTWMLGGIIPTMIYYGLTWLSPKIFLFAACALCVMVSTFTGSSWTTMGTVGVALVGVGTALQVPLGMTVGAIISGAAVIDQSAITGEFEPAEKTAGDEVFAGTVVKSGNIQVKANKVGDQTVVSRIVGMVEASELKKAPIQRYADRFSNYLVPLNFLLCLSVWLVTHNAQKALKMLVIDYSCGIKLSTATAFSAAINTAVKQGVLIKGGAYIEQMSSANTVLLDKTGTVTEGKPKVVSMVVLDDEMDEREVLAYAMAAEETSTHPLASAILDYGRQIGAQALDHGEIITEVSRGSRTDVDGHIVRVGNMKYMKENGVTTAKAVPDGQGAIPNYVGIDDKLVAVLFAMDSPRDNVRRAVNALRYDGVGDIEILTGDMEPQARAVAEQIGVDGFKAQLLPEQKAEAVLRLQTQGNGVVMVGDGINDAPALTRADIGVAIGAGTDIAIDAADVVLMKSRLSDVPAGIRLSRATLRNIHENLFWAFIYNIIGIPLAAGVFINLLGWQLNPMFGAAAMSLSSFCVVTNALRLNLLNIRSTKHDKKIKSAKPAEMKTIEVKETKTMEKTIKINGMMCPHCEATVKKCLEAFPQVTSAEVSHEKGTAVIQLNAEISDAELKKAIEDKGYEVVG